MITTHPVSRPALGQFLVVCVSLCLPAIGCMPRHEIRTSPTVWQLRGSVVDVRNGTVEIRHKTGRVMTLVVDDRTTYTRHHEPADSAALRRGVRVAIDVERTPQADRALHVELFGRGS